jgi:indole-3-glycerol phosphate synthase
VILDEIAGYTRKRIASAKERAPLEAVKEQALSISPLPPGFEEALSQSGMSFICEIKKASPSKGVIAQDFPYLRIAQEYEAAGGAAVSVLTEPAYFLGRDVYLQEIANAVKLPVLRKDFILDPYQIYEAKVFGASAALLICALLDEHTLASFIETAQEIGLSALVEAHTEQEVAQALRAGARIIGVNNRDLRTFHVDLQTSLRLRGLVPPDRLFISESGIHSRSDIRALENAGVDGVLIGEALMRAPDKSAYLTELRGR